MLLVLSIQKRFVNGKYYINDGGAINKVFNLLLILMPFYLNPVFFSD